MARKKSQEDLEQENLEIEPKFGTDDREAESLQAAELESDEEANEIPDDVDEDGDSAQAESRSQEASAPEKKSRRAPTTRKRSRKESSHPLTTLAKSPEKKEEGVELSSEEEQPEEKAEVEKKPRAQRRAPRKPAPANHSKPATEPADWEDRWASLEALSQKMSGQLERAETFLKDFPKVGSIGSEALSTRSREPQAEALVQKPSPLTRIAAVTSILAIILSFVSLSLSQNARQAALSAQVASIGLQDPRVNIKPVVQPMSPKAPEPRALPFALSMRQIRKQAAAVFPFDIRRSKKSARPEIAMRTDSGFKPRAPIILFRKTLADTKRMSK